MSKTSDEKILAALLANPTNKAAAAACGLSESQLYARKREPAFKAKYQEARTAMLDDTTAALQKHTSAAVEEMASIAADPETPAQTRLNACESILKYSLKLTEQIEIMNRLEMLESRMRQETKI